MAGKRPKGVTHKTGRPTSYTEELGALLCERIATTPRGLDFICDGLDDMPSPRTVHRWLNDHEAFRQSYLRARERQADLIFDECLEIADDASRDVKLVGGEENPTEVCNTEFVQRAKLRIDTRMRMAGKLSPKKYGDAMQLKHADADGEKLPLGDTDLAAKAAAIMARLALRKLADEGE